MPPLTPVGSPEPVLVSSTSKVPVVSEVPTVMLVAGARFMSPPLFMATPPLPPCKVVADVLVLEPRVVVCAVALAPKLQVPVPQSTTVELVVLALPMVTPCTALPVPILMVRFWLPVPIEIAPVPELRVTGVFVVALPMVTEVAVPVAIFKATPEAVSNSGASNDVLAWPVPVMRKSAVWFKAIWFCM